MNATLSPAKPIERSSPPPRASRRVLFDASRLIAAYAIVWLHCPRSQALIPSTAIGRFAVPFFTAGAVFFLWQSLGRGTQRSLREYAGNRVLRLYVPFAAWTIAYLAFKLLKKFAAPGQPNEFPGIEVLLAGGSYHLWFLPFLLAVSIAVFSLGRTVVKRTDLESKTALACGALGAMIAMLPSPAPTTSVSLVELWWPALPAALWGVTFAIAYRQGAAELLERPLATWLGLIGMIAGVVLVWQFGRWSFVENAAGLCFLVFALGKWDGPVLRRIAALGPLAYGIYLAHLLLIKVCESVAAKFALSPSAAIDVLTFVFAAVGSTLLAWTLSRYHRTKWLVA